MTNPPPPRIARRTVPGTPVTLSVVSVSLDPPAVAPPAADARSVALLRRAREVGVTTFDVARARFPARAERLIATAFPSSDPDLVVIVGRSIESLAAERGPTDEPGHGGSLAEALQSSLEQSRRRLAPVPLSVLEWDMGNGGGTTGGDAHPWALLVPDTYRPPLIRALRVRPELSALPTLPDSAQLYSGEFSLLDEGVAPLFDSGPPRPEAGLIAHNPFGDGRLDGTRFAARSVPGEPGQGPVDVRRLHAEFDPVLRLGFLTEDRRRTLAQAALHFVLRWPWVATCVIPLPAPERFDEILGYGSTPPLTDEELTRLSRVK